jgi:hypothetical protein
MTSSVYFLSGTNIRSEKNAIERFFRSYYHVEALLR